MPDAVLLGPDRLLPFLAAVALVELTPGPNMGYLALVAARFGWRGGLVTIAGVTLGLLIYLTASVLGLAEAALRWPWLYHGLRWAGVAYLAWLALDAWRDADRPEGPPPPRNRLFTRGLLANLLNPKAAVFYVAVLPTFVRDGAELVASEALVLGLIHVAVSVAVHLAIVMGAAMAAGRSGQTKRPAGAPRALQKVFAVALLGMAGWLALS